MDKQRFQELLSQALAYDAVSDPRGQIESTLYQAINETLEYAAAACEADAASWINLRNSSIGGRCDGVQAQGSKACAELIRAMKLKP